MYNLKGKKLTDKTNKEIDKLLSRLLKQGFSSISEYGIFYGYKTGMEVLNSFNISVEVM